jgi:hypothetical protein
MPKFRSNKGQVGSLSTVLIVMVIIMLVFTTYVWGRGLLDHYEARASANYAQGKLIEMRTDITEVMHDGPNASRVIHFDSGGGKLGILEGSSCSGGLPNANGIFYEIKTTRPISSSTDNVWFLTDPLDTNDSCQASYDSHYAGILLAKGDLSGAEYTTSFLLWFRNLTTPSDTYLISISAGGATEVSGGTHTLIVRNLGTSSPAPNTYLTNIQVDIT